MTTTRLALLIIALAATVYASASYITDFAADFEASTIIAVLALGGFFAAQERGRL